MSREFSFQHGETVVVYTIDRSHRNTLSISVSQSKGVRVKMPIRVSFDRGVEFVESRKEFIIKHLNKIAERDAKSPYIKYTDGDTISYLGASYTIKINIIKDVEGIELTSNNMIINTSHESRAELLIKAWYYKRAQEIILPMAKEISEAIKVKLGVTPASLSVKFVSSYWGICSGRGAIRFNVELVRMETSLIEYVIIHELCHLVHHDHSKRFYELFKSFMPDYNERRRKMKDNYTIIFR